MEGGKQVMEKRELNYIYSLDVAFKNFRKEEKRRQAEFDKEYEKEFGHKRPSIKEQIERMNARKGNK